jgi:hypothetical protein
VKEEWNGPTPKQWIPHTNGSKSKRMDSEWMSRLPTLYNPDIENFDITMVFGINRQNRFDEWLMKNGSDVRFSDLLLEHPNRLSN